ncbi:MAG TPA: FGGY-family carbohydrate kinase [Spirochaetia bacterium]|nr:FGGY-family carbohydrate kinase [Spirochaetia bacterium]
MEYVIGIDLGTSYFKVGLVDRNGKLRGLGRIAVPVQGTASGYSEVSVDGFVNALKEGIAAALTEGKARREEIIGVSYSSQANSFLLLDRTGEPLTPLILWTDSRSDAMPREFAELVTDPSFLSVTGIGVELGPNSAIAKCLWFRDHEPVLYSRASRIMTISDYLTYRFSGELRGDEGTASLLGIFDLKNERLWEEGLKMLRLPPSMFSELMRPGSVAGRISNDGAGDFGLPVGIPFAVGSLDHHMASVGAGIGFLADTSESTGTVLACIKLSERYEPKKNACMGPGFDAGTYYTLVFNNNGAATYEWYGKEYGDGLSPRELDAIAAEIAPGADGLCALPEAKRYGDLSGFVGAKAIHGKGHYSRAILESTAYSLSELVDMLAASDKVPNRMLATGGGARSDLWLSIQAAMVGTILVRTGVTEPACFGAAMSAACAAGIFPSVWEAGRSWIRMEKEFFPDKDWMKEYETWKKVYRTVKAQCVS